MHTDLCNIAWEVLLVVVWRMHRRTLKLARLDLLSSDVCPSVSQFALAT